MSPSINIILCFFFVFGHTCFKLIFQKLIKNLRLYFMFLEIVVFCWPAGQFPTRICWTENKNMNDTKKDNIDKPTELDRKKDKREKKNKGREKRLNREPCGNWAVEKSYAYPYFSTWHCQYSVHLPSCSPALCGCSRTEGEM